MLSWRQDPNVSCADYTVTVSAVDGDGEAKTYVSRRAAATYVRGTPGTTSLLNPTLPGAAITSHSHSSHFGSTATARCSQSGRARAITLHGASHMTEGRENACKLEFHRSACEAFLSLLDYGELVSKAAPCTRSTTHNTPKCKCARQHTTPRHASPLHPTPVYSTNMDGQQSHTLATSTMSATALLFLGDRLGCPAIFGAGLHQKGYESIDSLPLPCVSVTALERCCRRDRGQAVR